MSANARNRHSLEPLAAALLGFGLLHLLLGYLVLDVLSEARRKTAANTSSKLVWNAPVDFLFQKKVSLDLPQAQLRPSGIARPPAPATAPVRPLSKPPQSASSAASSELQKMRPVPAPVTATKAPQTPPEKTLAATMQANLDGLSALASSGSLGPESMPQSVRAESPAIRPKNDPAPPVPPLTQAPSAPAVTAAPPSTGSDSSTVPVMADSNSSGNQKATNKYITLSAILPLGSAPSNPRLNKPVLNLLDIANINANERATAAEAGGADMEAVEKALQQAILNEWIAPAVESVPPSQRRATMEVAILRDGTIADASIKTASGSNLLDASVRRAADRLKKIPATLPSNFPKERYELRVNFQIE